VPPTVNLQPPTGTSKKRPKYAPGDGTPRQRAIMISVAIACLVGAFLIPTHEPSIDELGPEEAKLQPAPPAPPAPAQSARAASNTRNNPPSSDSSLPPIHEVAMFSVNTPQEVDGRLATLSNYYTAPRLADCEAAYKALTSIGDLLVPKLPKLIETSTGPELTNYARAALDLKAVNTVPAMIARLHSPDRGAGAQKQMMAALSSFDDPKAQEFVLEAMKGNTPVSSNFVWPALGEKMTEAQVNLAYDIVSNGKPGWEEAAGALGRYGSTQQSATPLVQRIQQEIQNKKGDARLAMMKAVAQMEPSTAANMLSFYISESEPAVRAVVFSALVRSAQHRSTAMEAARNDDSPQVRAAILNAFTESPSDDVLDFFVDLLANDDVAAIARRGLVMANKGVDLGSRRFAWQQWLKQKRELQKSGGKLPDVKPEPAYESGAPLDAP